MIFKVLNSNNPQAPHNLTKFSFKDRCFKTEDIVDQLVFHYSVDGNILLQDSGRFMIKTNTLIKRSKTILLSLTRSTRPSKKKAAKFPTMVRQRGKNL